MKETNHDYQDCLVGNYYDQECSGRYNSWSDFKENHFGFLSESFDDTYHFVFRYDIHKRHTESYTLELCIMLQRKGIYTHLEIDNISQEELDGEIKKWLEGRYNYLKNLWIEIDSESSTDRT